MSLASSPVLFAPMERRHKWFEVLWACLSLFVYSNFFVALPGKFVGGAIAAKAVRKS